jgi:predicted outer membrane repeat protein
MSNRSNRWFSRFAKRRHPGGRVPERSRPRTRLNIEPLECRLVPATFNVNSTADILNPPAGVVTLRSAIEQANATPGGNTIKLTVPGVYKITIPPASPDDTPAGENNHTGDFDILPGGGNLTIVNTSGGKVAVDGNHLDRVFDINPDATTAKFTVTMRGFTIQNGIAAPGDTATGTGGGIRDQGNVSLTLTHMVVTNNSASADGGGVAMENVVNSTYTLTINDSKITNNHAGDAGGGIETDGTGTVIINPGTVITDNTDINQGAGIYLDAIAPASANLTVKGAFINHNSSLGTVNGLGGGISNAGNGAVTIMQSTIADNFAATTGGGFSDENNGLGTLVVLNSLFENNTAAGNGGAIFASGPSTTITSTELRGNVSGHNGGGIFASGTTLILQNSTLANNTATGNGDGTGGGGGVELETTGAGSAGSHITDTTITGNRALNNAGANGGGIDAPASFTGDVKLLNDTINLNFADNGGGVFWAGTTGSNFVVQNTIIAKNTASTAGPAANNPAGMFTDMGGNLIGVSGAGSGNTGFTAASTQTGTVAAPLDPLLGPLQNNGGPKVGAKGHRITLQTEAPLSGSPAIGKGILNGAPPTDERGFPSVVNGKINVGAVSQADEDNDSDTGSAAMSGVARALAQQHVDAVFADDSDVTTNHKHAAHWWPA